MLHLVTAVIHPQVLGAVKEVLRGEGIFGMTVAHVRGFGRHEDLAASVQHGSHQVDFAPEVKVDLLVPAEDADRVAGVIAEKAGIGGSGGAKIWITPVDRAIRVRTGQMGNDAL